MKLKTSLFIIPLAFLMLILWQGQAHAADLIKLEDNYSSLQTQEAELRAKLQETTTQKTTLQSQVSYINNSIQLTQVEIDKLLYELNEKEQDLQMLSTDIETLSTRLERLSVEVDFEIGIFRERASASYKANKRMPLEIFLSAHSPSEVVSIKHYLEKFETEDRNLLGEMQEIASVYKDQKDQLETKKLEVEDLKASIESNKDSQVSKQQTLEGQKSTKNELLAVTKNDEAKYQQELADIQAEQAAIANAIARLTSGNLPEGTKVKAGYMVGIQGCTGNCTGDHVHFGVYKKCGDGWCHTNPEPYAESGAVNWPLDSFEVTQEYGATDFAKHSGLYADKFHNGMDLAGPIGSMVTAPMDGTLNYSSDSLGGKGALIYGDDLMVLMWHIR